MFLPAQRLHAEDLNPLHASPPRRMLADARNRLEHADRWSVDDHAARRDMPLGQQVADRHDDDDHGDECAADIKQNFHNERLDDTGGTNRSSKRTVVRWSLVVGRWSLFVGLAWRQVNLR